METTPMSAISNNGDLQLISTIDFFSYTKNWSVEKLLRGITIYLERSFARYTYYGEKKENYKF